MFIGFARFFLYSNKFLKPDMKIKMNGIMSTIDFAKRITVITFIFLAGMFHLSANEPAYRTISFLEGVKQPVQSLNGAWQFRFAPTGKWETVQVPGELAMQGYAIEHDKPYTYRKTFTVPPDYAGKRVILRFDGVYSHARLTINGKFVREHHGGFTRWETDVTGFVKIGSKKITNSIL